MLNTIVYYELDDTPEAIQWVNNNLITTMVPDFLQNQVVHLRAEMDIGYDQAHMVTLSNNADLSTIIDKRATLQGTNY